MIQAKGSPVSATAATQLAARLADSNDGVATGADGIARGFSTGKGTLSFPLVAVRVGLYLLRLDARAPGGEKEFEAQVGSSPPITGRVPRSTAFATREVGVVELAAGENVLTVGRGWGYYEIRAIELLPAPSASPLRPVRAVPVDAKATRTTRRLLKQITAKYGSATLSGQYGEAESKYIQVASGRLPAILGADLMEYSPSRRARGADPKGLAEHLIQMAKSGSKPLLTLSWHWNAPAGLLDRELRQPDGKVVDARWYKGFYTNATTFDFAAALADPKSENYRLLLRDMDAIAVELAKFARAGIPLLWRPLHEADGGWFWWGARGAGPFVLLWKLLYHRLTVVHGLHNLLWVASSGLKPEWYPGDAFVDVVGIDSYPADPADALAGDWRTLLARFDGRKPLALTEFGAVPDIMRMHRYGVRWAYFVTWSGRPQKMGQAAVKRLYQAPKVVNRAR
ncbi:MAG: glycosyl hydrolase [Armatimonadota bacterium]